MLNSLNEEQLKAVQTVDKNLCIIAGAGSGKTRVITTRIAYLIKQYGIKDNRILAITFTNRAANEMKHRLQNMIPNTTINAMTIHALCVKILREEIKHFNFKTFTILDVDDQKRIINTIIKNKKIDIGNLKLSDVINYISNCKMEYVSTSEAYKLAYNEKEILLATLYEKYEKRRIQLESFDFNDLLLYCEKALNIPEVQHKWSHRFSFIHVDEFQDVDQVQYNIIKKLTNQYTNLCVVGDPDQCIYTWRGSQMKYILDFKNDFDNVETVILHQNYRSTPEILNAANSLIKQNKNRIEKNLTTPNINGEKVIHFSGNSDSEESNFIIEEIQKLRTVPLNEIAILYRSNFSSKNIEKALVDARIPYVIHGSLKFFERSEIKDAIAYLRMLNDNAAIDISLDRIINVPRRGVGDKTVATLQAIAISENVRMYDVLKKMTTNNQKIKKSLVDFVVMIEKYRQKLVSTPIHKVLGQLLAESGYYAMLQDSNEEDRLENIKSFIFDIAEYEEKNQEASLEMYLQEIALYFDKESENNEAVHLMSVHAAKGNEFDYVFIYNFSEGLFPNEKAILEGLLEEERRIAYVAMTRARKKLYLCESRGYSVINDRVKTTSRFINEIDSRFITQFKKQFKPTINHSNKSSYVVGEKVVHEIFGNGIIVAIQESIATIAFPAPHGIKKILLSHSALKKRGTYEK